MSEGAETFFGGHPLGLAAYHRVRSAVDALGPAEVRVSRSQVAFRRRRGFAFLWLPGRWLAHPAADVVLSLALPRRDDSARFKEVVHPSPRVWMHHLEVREVGELDDQVLGWLAEAYDAAG